MLGENRSPYIKVNMPDQQSPLLNQIRKDSLPCHIAIIMDGNGRWAKEKGLPRVEGHKAGKESVRITVETVRKLGVKYLTLYAFSTENWKRPKDEIDTLMNLLFKFLREEVEKMVENGVKLSVIGDISNLPGFVRRELKAVERKTENCNKLTVNLALSYGSRQEIIMAVKAIARDCLEGNLKVNAINEKKLSSFLYTAGQPDPDLLIRTSSMFRISNFLLWQIAYTEIYFTDVYWPDFREDHLYRAIIDYQSRERRFGDISQEK